jgi:exopolysaccharide biosynthesis polyprenyl glycosylphosphotransferase
MYEIPQPKARARQRPGFARIGRAAAAQPWWRDRARRRLLAGADLLSAIGFAAFLWLLSGGDIRLAFWSVVVSPAWILLAKLHGLYDRDHRVLRHLTVDELPSLLGWALTSVVLTGLILSVSPAGPPELRVAFAAFLAVCGTALLLRGTTRWLWRRLTPPERAVVVGDGPLADEARRKLELFRDIHAVVVDQLEASRVERLDEDADWLRRVDRVIVAGLSLEERMIRELITACRYNRTKLSIIPPVRGRLGTAVKLSHVADLPLVEYNTWDVSRSTMLIKRMMDVGVASVLLVVLAPLAVLIALAVVLDDPGPVFFAQLRAGLNGRPFRLIKFRTMVTDAEERLADLVQLDQLPTPMFKLRDDPRVTRVGRLLRRFSLDELPQLVNVLLGQMSLVGPRPEQVELVERYLPEHRFRLDVKPGITGPMQVFGRGHLSFDERLSVEREYIENLSLARDLRLIAHTLPAVILGNGAI